MYTLEMLTIMQKMVESGCNDSTHAQFYWYKRYNPAYLSNPALTKDQIKEQATAFLITFLELQPSLKNCSAQALIVIARIIVQEKISSLIFKQKLLQAGKEGNVAAYLAYAMICDPQLARKENQDIFEKIMLQREAISLLVNANKTSFVRDHLAACLFQLSEHCTSPSLNGKFAELSTESCRWSAELKFGPALLKYSKLLVLQAENLPPSEQKPILTKALNLLKEAEGRTCCATEIALVQDKLKTLENPITSEIINNSINGTNPIAMKELIDELHVALNNSMKENDKLKQENTLLMERIAASTNDNKAKLENSAKEKAALETELVDAKKSLNNLTENFESLGYDLTSLRNHLARLRLEYDKAKTELAEARSQLQQVLNENYQFFNTNIALNGFKHHLEVENTRLAYENIHSNLELVRLRARIQSLQRKQTAKSSSQDLPKVSSNPNARWQQPTTPSAIREDDPTDRISPQPTT